MSLRPWLSMALGASAALLVSGTAGAQAREPEKQQRRYRARAVLQPDLPSAQPVQPEQLRLERAGPLQHQRHRQRCRDFPLSPRRVGGRRLRPVRQPKQSTFQCRIVGSVDVSVRAMDIYVRDLVGPLNPSDVGVGVGGTGGTAGRAAPAAPAAPAARSAASSPAAPGGTGVGGPPTSRAYRRHVLVRSDGRRPRHGGYGHAPLGRSCRRR